ncbi:hypothetical protein H257_15989 [Aphanomyces astaci]|uniref:Reverse transcriptase RNase H-like domain-containing protein n=1 Tax=Aphanomyces astaci TaxID=112090 RepID=W4FK49_APHAT|nr:hypothetical protein H257_15989 [Aphanomyces astaci]ETV67865.1 hypothetical protein H257_15989 [Aphanomyces astaci]|eukprot:XP_009842610.1 hypothetical protein H257_15989 [Aphanomyces astaci]
MSLPPATSRAALPFTQSLLGTENFDEWFFELTSVILAGELATHCAQVETATRSGSTACRRTAASTTHAHPPLGVKLTEWLAENCSTDEVIAKSICNHVDELIKFEKTAIARSCALVYASLSPTVQRNAAPGIRDECAHLIISSLRRMFSSDKQKHATAISLQVNLQAFDKMLTAVEKLEGSPLSDSHFASALLAALPECIAPDLFIKGYAAISRPLERLKTAELFQWDSDCDVTLDKLKRALASPPICLSIFRTSKWREYVIAYASQALNQTQQRRINKTKGSSENECFGIVWATSKFRTYLDRRNFTDHAALAWLFKSGSHSTNAKLARWVCHLQSFQFTVTHRPGVNMGCVDGLSRLKISSIVAGHADGSGQVLGSMDAWGDGLVLVQWLRRSRETWIAQLRKPKKARLVRNESLR